MSLDVSLMGGDEEETCSNCGATHIVSEELFTANITHNLGYMADKAGIYKILWRPEVVGAVVASDISSELARGLGDMKKRPEYYKPFDAGNKWGTYKDFIPWLEKYLEACLEYPDAKIEISR